METLYSSTRSLLTGEPIPERSVSQQIEEELCDGCPKLTYRQRIIGFVSCFCVGILIEFGSFFRIVELLEGNPKPFAVLYSIGNIISICSSFFLAGPWTQLKKMFAPTRAIASIIFLSSIIATLFCAIYKDVPARGAIIILLILVQFAALTWYFLSYIPYARDFIIDLFRRTCCDCDK